jgi:predicted ATPase
MGAFVRDWALAEAGAAAEGISRMREDLAAFRATGAELGVPFFLCTLAEAQGSAGQVEEGLTTLADALATLERTKERWCEAELYRIKGDLLVWQGTAPKQAETWLRRAIDVAHAQQACGWELRARTSLARLWRKQGRHTEARTLLAESYSWFGEGFETPDLTTAKALLESLPANG